MKNNLRTLLIFLLILGVSAIFLVAFRDKIYLAVSFLIIFLSFIPFFYSFEKNADTVNIVLLAIMTALAVSSRALFYFLPHFKPMTAIIIICGMALGPQVGFLCGSLSAFISDFIFGQGPWTPFQMFAWGIIGFSAYYIARKFTRNKITLIICGAFSGLFYSCFMNLFTVFWSDNAFNITRYIALFISSLPVTLVYIVSNIIFLLALTKPISRKLERIKSKYDLK